MNDIENMRILQAVAASEADLDEIVSDHGIATILKTEPI
jgi:hypothetical protein